MEQSSGLITFESHRMGDILIIWENISKGTLLQGVSYWSWSSSCGRQSFDQFVWVSNLPLGPLTRFYLVLLFSFDCYFILFPTAFSLTRKRVCSLQCLHSLVRPLTTNNHTLPSHPRLCSLSAASYDSQGLRWKYSNPPPHGS
jgi:hypothetical protein